MPSADRHSLRLTTPYREEQGEEAASPRPSLPVVFLVGDQQNHHHIEVLIELMNAQMGRAITHTS
eukprot:CAMPEP_0182567088 /NCGR_PEP_ID=MMETSP1324-20130603/8396_1 /TAXON_ID=236786 /ORGANISM="Florenciella sp., Strain RCC1587" /LENGTH=64 /DNA_ID=CAMNT_0024781015 /DNA_START=69 /DNA_END=260 /DNA_ORIENTATION=+